MKLRKWLCILALMLLVCAASVSRAAEFDFTNAADAGIQAEEKSQFPFLAETNELAVNVRTEMSTRSAKAGRLERGTQLIVFSAQLNDAGEVWYAVELKDGTKGYIRSDLLIRSEQQTPVASLAFAFGAGDDAAEDEQAVPFKAKTTQNAVNVRKEASTSSAKAGKIARGDILTVLSSVVNAANETWYAVELADGTRGYVRGDLLIETDEMEIVKASYQNTAKSSSSLKSGNEKKTSSGSGGYIGNRKTKKFHRTSCRTLPAAKNQVKLSSREKAISSGYVPCKNCNP